MNQAVIKAVLALDRRAPSRSAGKTIDDRHIDRLLQLALQDELTSLHNRRGFTLLAEQQLRVARKMKRSMLLFFADVDGLKQINDTFGHQAGDEALVLAASCLKKSFRSSDLTARIGGDEFVALTAGANCSLAAICRRLQKNLAMHRGAQRRYRVSLSVGVARFDPDAAVSLKDLMAQADRALYAQRQQKRSAPRQQRFAGSAANDAVPELGLAIPS
jgi:diguanylate cyclase (GGDEF)-like protein